MMIDALRIRWFGFLDAALCEPTLSLFAEQIAVKIVQHLSNARQ